MTRDPVCGMQIEDKLVAEKCEYEGQTYYFCSPSCKQTFEQHPERFTSNAA